MTFRSTKHKYSKDLILNLALDCSAAGMSKEEAMTKYIACVAHSIISPSPSQYVTEQRMMIYIPPYSSCTKS